MQVGAVIGGRYRLTDLIGEGGMASVWRAQDETLQRAVAIKLLYLRPQRDPGAQVEQFLREARLAASIQHRNVIHTVDFGVTPEQVPFMVMELLHGESLAERFARAPALSVEEMLQLTSLTLRGLAAVHAAGIVHRDLKPGNVFLQRDTDAVYPKILDFGISRSLVGGPRSAVATQEGLIIGTPDYMAPEQARGETDIDRRADIYSMGAIVFEGITGRTPFQAASIPELIAQIITTTPPTLIELRPDVPAALSQCVERAMSHDRAQRFSDASAFREALARAAEQALSPLGALSLSEAPPRRVQAAAPVAAGAPTLLAAAGSRAFAGPAAPPTRQAPADSSAGWGELERTSARMQGHSPAPARRAASGPLSPRPAAKPSPSPADRALATVLDRGEPANRQSPPRPQKAAGARGQQAGRPATSEPSPHDDALLGANPLDAFAGQDGGSLELDFTRGVPPGGRTPPGGAYGARPGPRGARAGEVSPASASAPPRARATRRSQPSAAIWFVPLVLGLALIALLLLPRLFSLPAPDPDAAAARQADNPALQGGLRWGSRSRPKLAEVAPAQRDVTF